MKNLCWDLLADLARLRDLAKDHSLFVLVNEVSCRRAGRGVVTLHVIFKNSVGQVLQYWPGTGRVWNPRTKEKGQVADWWEALDMAARIAAEEQR